MSNRTTFLITAGALLATLGAAAPLAAVAATPTQAVTTTAALPAEQQYAGIHYTSGGVTKDEAAAFKRELHNYPLAIELVERQKTGKHDEYTADATVRIAKSGKEIFAAKAQGPFMLVRLEPGTYDITATLNKHTLHKRHVVVTKGKSTRTTFEFPAGTD